MSLALTRRQVLPPHVGGAWDHEGMSLMGDPFIERREALTVEMPDDLRAEHQPDPFRIEQGTQCVCMCGASCVSYVGHLEDVVEHRQLWDRLCAEHGHPLENFARAGIDPYRD